MDKAQLLREPRFKAIRSSGAGGQHVNKVSSKIELSFDINTSHGLSSLEKERLILKLSHRITKEKLLILHCDESRSQHRNKELVLKRFLKIVERALKIPKPRKATRPSKAAIEKRLQNKKKTAQKKANRNKPDMD